MFWAGNEAGTEGARQTDPDVSREEWSIATPALEIFRTEAGFLGDLGQKCRTDFVIIVKRERIIRPSCAFEAAVRAGLPCHFPVMRRAVASP
jgi:hypothetical protein